MSWNIRGRCIFISWWWPSQFQQSSAFKILRTRLKTVPTHSFLHMQPLATSSTSEFPGLSAIRRTASASGGAYNQILSHIPSIPTGSSLALQGTEDTEKNTEMSNGVTGINFAMQLKQFELMQQQHRLHRVVANNSRPPRRPPVVPNQVLLVLIVLMAQIGFCE